MERRFALWTTTLYGLAVAVVAWRHELFRDEVRALSIAASSDSLGALARNLHNEGHPILWYLVLWAAVRATGSWLVLKPIAAAIGVAATYVFTRHAPFSRRVRALFVFGSLPLYEYGVMCRNYGVSMLLVFALAALYPSRRRHPWAIALLLVLLANSNVHSVVLVLAFALVLALDDAPTDGAPLDKRVIAVAALAVVGGMALAVFVALPDATTIVTSPPHGVAPVLRALAWAAISPMHFVRLVAGVPGELVLDVALVATLVHLRARPALCAALVFAAVGFSLLGDLVSPTWERHAGLFYAFGVAMLWLDGRAPRPSLARVAHGLVLAFLVVQIGIGVPDVAQDLAGPRTQSAALGRLLSTGDLQDAVVVGDPEPYLEALPYYAKNRIWLVRESRWFAIKVSFTTASRARVTLDETLDAAHRLHAETGAPVVIVLAHRMNPDGPSSVTYAYGRQYSWSPASLARLAAETTMLARLDDAPGENYDVYRLR